MSKELNTTTNKKPTLVDTITSPKFKSSLQQYLPKGFSAERLAKVILSDVRKTPKLLQCDEKSFIAAVSQIASLGLEPGVLGYCYLLPYENKKKGTTECQLIIGYKGMIDLVYRSGKVATIQANTVDEADEFRFNYGCKPDLYHVPARAQTGKVIYVYAIVTFKDGSYQFIVITMDEIKKIKACSKGATGYGEAYHPWTTWPEEMMKKSALKRLFKLVPISIEVAKAVAIDESNDITNDFINDYNSMTDVTGHELETSTDALLEAINASESANNEEPF